MMGLCANQDKPCRLASDHLGKHTGIRQPCFHIGADSYAGLGDIRLNLNIPAKNCTTKQTNKEVVEKRLQIKMTEGGGGAYQCVS